MSSAISSSVIEPPRPISNGMLAILLVIAVEAMFFTGLISAFVVARSQERAWPPLGQPRLPIEATAVNTALLLASGLTLLFSMRKNRSHPLGLAAAFAMGLGFVLLQGHEWIRLLGFGLTAASSLYGGFFYLIVGAHAFHAVAGLVALAFLFGPVSVNQARVTASYWYFVVLLWPVLYALVYLT